MQLKDAEKQEAMRLMIAKFNRGDSLSDEELKKLHKFYEEAVVMFDCLGPRFELAFDYARREFETLNMFKENRKRHAEEDRRYRRKAARAKKNRKAKVNHCPNCGSDEGVLDSDTGKVECDTCGFSLLHGWAFKPA